MTYYPELFHIHSAECDIRKIVCEGFYKRFVLRKYNRAIVIFFKHAHMTAGGKNCVGFVNHNSITECI